MLHGQPICDDGWGHNEAMVVCRFVIIRATKSVGNNNEIFFSARFYGKFILSGTNLRKSMNCCCSSYP